MAYENLENIGGGSQEAVLAALQRQRMGLPPGYAMDAAHMTPSATARPAEDAAANIAMMHPNDPAWLNALKGGGQGALAALGIYHPIEPKEDLR